MQTRLDSIRIVLVETTHAGNLGSVARAMKTMGLSRLVLVNPQAKIDAQAISMASGADEILANADVVSELSQAIAPCSLVLGASARSRRLDVACMSARDCVAEVKKHTVQQPVALVFGPEHSGLSNQHLSLCHAHVFIPSVPSFSSLNLSQAVQVLCYELYVGLQGAALPQTAHDEHVATMALAGDVDGVHQHFVEVMQQIEFLNPSQPRKLSQRIRRMLHRAELEQNEVNILRGFLASIQKKLP